jgi:hypothetical protein
MEDTIELTPTGKKIFVSALKSLITALWVWLIVALPLNYIFGIDDIPSHKIGVTIAIIAFFIVWLYEGKKNGWYEE